jgi:hypothetical protein
MGAGTGHAPRIPELILGTKNKYEKNKIPKKLKEALEIVRKNTCLTRYHLHEGQLIFVFDDYMIDEVYRSDALWPLREKECKNLDSGHVWKKEDCEVKRYCVNCGKKEKLIWVDEDE